MSDNNSNLKSRNNPTTFILNDISDDLRKDLNELESKLDEIEKRITIYHKDQMNKMDHFIDLFKKSKYEKEHGHRKLYIEEFKIW